MQNTYPVDARGYTDTAGAAAYRRAATCWPAQAIRTPAADPASRPAARASSLPRTPMPARC